MKTRVATELLQLRLFAVGHHQRPSLGCLCIFGGKVSLVDLPAGVDVGILHRTNELQLEREARSQALKRKILSVVYNACVTLECHTNDSQTQRYFF